MGKALFPPGAALESSVGESLTVLALGAERDFAVDDRWAGRAFGGLLVGSSPVDGDECPERGPDLEQVVGEAPVAQMSAEFPLDS